MGVDRPKQCSTANYIKLCAGQLRARRVGLGWSRAAEPTLCGGRAHYRKLQWWDLDGRVPPVAVPAVVPIAPNPFPKAGEVGR